MSVSSTFEAGEIFAKRYKLLRPLGKGGMGQVFLAYDISLGLQIAVKILHPELCRDQTHAQRFYREVQLNRRIGHRNVIKSFDVGTFEGMLFITMEYIEGQTLKEKLEATKRIPSDEAIQILREICIGLAEVHNVDIIHRDLKPGNVMITNQGVVKIGDFGVARPAMSDLTAHDEIIGCAPYIAPEVWLGKPVSSQSDLYALGIMAHEMLTGELPFDGNSPAELMRKHLDSKPYPVNQIVPEIPGWLNNLVLKLLEKDPSDRFPSAHAVVNFITKCLENPNAGIVGGSTKSGIVDVSLLEALNRVETSMIEPEAQEALALPRRTKSKQPNAPQSESQLPSERLTRSAPKLAELAPKRSRTKITLDEQPLSLTKAIYLLATRILPVAAMLSGIWLVHRFCSPILLSWWGSQGAKFWDLVSQIAVGPLSLIASGLALALPMFCLSVFAPSFSPTFRSILVGTIRACFAAASLVLLTTGYILVRSIHAATSINTLSFESFRISFVSALDAAMPALLLIPKPVGHSFTTEAILPITINSGLSAIEAAPFYLLMALVLWRTAILLRRSVFKIESIAWYQTIPRIIITGVVLITLESYFSTSISLWLSKVTNLSLTLPIPPLTRQLALGDLLLGAFNWACLWLIATVLPRKLDN